MVVHGTLGSNLCDTLHKVSALVVSCFPGPQVYTCGGSIFHHLLDGGFHCFSTIACKKMFGLVVLTGPR
jgi:hypothetical protein